jgi:hypothetical protein
MRVIIRSRRLGDEDGSRFSLGLSLRLSPRQMDARASRQDKNRHNGAKTSFDILSMYPSHNLAGVDYCLYGLIFAP